MHIMLEARASDRVVVGESDPPCDFGAFVAERRGIAREEAEMQISRWLANYVPLCRRSSLPEMQRICA
jgi:hypothetical protein